MRIIGISGKSGSGKDTAADILLEGKMGLKVPFAAAIKARAKQLGWDGQKDTNGRVLLQYIGVRERKDNPRHWIDEAFAYIEAYAAATTRLEPVVIVIPDVRFVNEVFEIRARGGEVWRIERASAGLSGAAASHPSEVELDTYPMFDVVIYNDGSLEELRARVKLHL